MNRRRLHFALLTLFEHWNFDIPRMIFALQGLFPKQHDFFHAFQTWKERFAADLKNTPEPAQERLKLAYRRGVEAMILDLDATKLIQNADDRIAKWLSEFDPKPSAALEGSVIDPTLFFMHDIVLPTDTFLTENGKQQYKQLLTQAQDALSARDFELAHDFCQKAIATTEPESAQLYELTLLSYVRKETPKQIIFNALHENGDKLQKTLVFLQRCEKWQRAQKCPSETADQNVQQVAEQLLDELEEAYLDIEADYALEKEPKNDPRRRAAFRWIEVAWAVHEQIALFEHHAQGYFRQQAIRLLLELSGGGKFDWLAISRDELHDTTDLDAAQLFEHIKNWLIETAQQTVDNQAIVTENSENTPPLSTHEKAAKNDEILGEIYDKLFYKILVQKYFALKHQATKQEMDRQTLRQNVLTCLEALKIAYRLTGRRDFLRVAVYELIEEGILHWLNLKYDGSFDNHPETKQCHYEALSNLHLFIKLGKFKESEIFDRLEKNVAQRLKKETNTHYEQLKLKVKGALGVKPDMRQGVVKCLLDYELCYKVLWEKDIIKRCLEELMGWGILLWFDFDDNGKLTSHRQCHEIKFDAKQKTEQLIDLKLHEHLTPLSNANYPLYVVDALSTTIKKNIEMPDNQHVYNRAVTARMLEQLYFCHQINKNGDLLRLAIDELIWEKKFNWIDLKNGGLVSTPEALAVGYDVVKWLYKLLNTLKDEELKKKIHKKIADKHADEMLEDYNNNVGADRKKNNFFDRKKVVACIRQLKNCYMLYQDFRYLEMPLKELTTKTGKIEWYSYIYWNHEDNKRINFDALKEAEIFRNWSKQLLETRT